MEWTLSVKNDNAAQASELQDHNNELQQERALSVKHDKAQQALTELQDQNSELQQEQAHSAKNDKHRR